MTAVTATELLLAHDLSPTEHSALRFVQIHLLRYALEESEKANAALRTALQEDDCESWVPAVARVRATLDGDHGLNIDAHHRLAALADDEQDRAAHFCAAARSQVALGDKEGAISTLQRVLKLDRRHEYAVALLEELQRAEGRTDEVIDLLKGAAELHGDSRSAEMAFLLAGRATEANGDFEGAKRSYQEAAQKSTSSVSTIFALRRLALIQDDAPAYRSTLAEAAKLEADEGRARDGVFEYAQFLSDEGNEPGIANTLFGQVMPHETLGANAALRILLSTQKPETDLLQQATEVFIDEASDQDRSLMRIALGLEKGRRPELGSQSPPAAWENSWHRYRNFKESSNDKDLRKRSNSIFALGSALNEPRISSELMLHGLRTELLTAGNSDNEAYLLADELMQRWPDSAAVAVAVDETLSSADDPGARAAALESRLAYAEHGSARSSMKSARAQALLKAGRSEESGR